MKKTLYWTPRVLAILLIIFISLFALDVFSEPQWPLALAMHLIPSFILIAITVIAWKKEFIGGWLFIAAGAALFFFSRASIASMPVVIPPFVVGILFLIQGFKARSSQ